MHEKLTFPIPIFTSSRHRYTCFELFVAVSKNIFFCVCVIAQHELWRGIKTPAQQTLACPAPLYCCLDELLSLECLALPTRPSGNPGAVAKLTEK